MKDIEKEVRQILGNVKDADKVRKIMNLIEKVKGSAIREFIDSSHRHNQLKGERKKTFFEYILSGEPLQTLDSIGSQNR